MSVRTSKRGFSRLVRFFLNIFYIHEYQQMCVCEWPCRVADDVLRLGLVDLCSTRIYIYGYPYIDVRFCAQPPLRQSNSAAGDRVLISAVVGPTLYQEMGMMCVCGCAMGKKTYTSPHSMH